MNKKDKIKPKKHHQAVMVNGEIWYKPFTEEAIKKASELKNNQFVYFNPIIENDWRSIEQLGLYWQACKFVSERVDGENFTTQKKVDVYIRAQCDLYDWDNAIKDINGQFVYAPLMSIAFHNMPHLKACNYFTDAFHEMCGLVPGYSLDVERFIQDVKLSCKGSR